MSKRKAPAMPRYLIVEQDEHFLILCARDPGLGWSGDYWVDVEQAARLLRFADQAAAEQYALEVFTERG